MPQLSTLISQGQRSNLGDVLCLLLELLDEFPVILEASMVQRLDPVASKYLLKLRFLVGSIENEIV